MPLAESGDPPDQELICSMEEASNSDDSSVPTRVMVPARRFNKFLAILVGTVVAMIASAGVYKVWHLSHAQPAPAGNAQIQKFSETRRSGSTIQAWEEAADADPTVEFAKIPSSGSHIQALKEATVHRTSSTIGKTYDDNSG